jgi:hypothetical protein
MGRDTRARAMGLVTPGGRPVNPVNFAGAVLDRFGNEIPEGGKVMYRSPWDLILDVVQMTPVLLSPQQIQAGARPMVRVRVSTTFDVTCAVEQANMALVLIGVPLTREQQAELERQKAAAMAADNGQPAAGDAGPGAPPDEGGSSDEPPTTG